MLTVAFYAVLCWAVALHGWATRRLRTEARRQQALDALDGGPRLGQCSCGEYWFRFKDEMFLPHKYETVQLVCERCGASRVGRLRAGGLV